MENEDEKKHYIMNAYTKDTPFEKRIADTEEKIAKLVERKERLIKCQGLWNSLPFKEGDVAFHNTYGNILICEVTLNVLENTEQIEYRIVDRKRNTHKVKLEELIPITPSTKVLYGKV